MLVRKSTLASFVVLGLGLALPRLLAAAESVPPGYGRGNGDVNGDGEIDLSDVIYLASWRFLGGPAPVPLWGCFDPREDGGLEAEAEPIPAAGSPPGAGGERTPDDGRFLFGSVGLALGQVARLSAVAPVPDDGSPIPDDGAPAINATLRFVDANGTPIVTRSGTEVSRRVTLRAGQAASLDLDAREVLGQDQVRAQVRPELLVQFSPDDNRSDLLRWPNPTLEVFTRLGGRSELVYADPQKGPEVLAEREVPTPCDGRFHFGSVGIGVGQVARLGVSSQGPPGDRLPACRVSLRFLRPGGEPLRDRSGREVRLELDLRAGWTRWLDLDSRDVLGVDEARAQLRAEVSVIPVPDDGRPGPCRDVAATLEVFDRRTGHTQLFYGNPRFEPAQPSTILFPGPRFPTLQAAIDAVPDGGTLRIAPGRYTIEEPLYVRGKRCFIKGPGRGRGAAEDAELFAPRPLRVVEARSAVGVINFVDGGGGLEGFEIEGGDAAVVVRGTSDDSFTVKDMKLAHTGRGILHLAPSNLTVEACTIHSCLWNGISFAPGNLPLIPNLTVHGLQLIDGENIGIYVSHGGLEVIHAALGGWSGGGIAVDNSSSAIVLESFLIQNSKFGILFYQAGGVILDTTIQNTLSAAGLLGDGITIWCSSAYVRDLEVKDSDRASISNFGGHLDIQDSVLLCDAFNLGAEEWTCAGGGGGVPTLDCGEDPACPSVLCGCPNATGGCHAQSYQLEAPPPVGGLE